MAIHTPNACLPQKVEFNFELISLLKYKSISYIQKTVICINKVFY